jgi:hypothetical protein
MMVLGLFTSHVAAAAAAELHELFEAMPSSSNRCEGQRAIFKTCSALAPAHDGNRRQQQPLEKWPSYQSNTESLC